MRLALVLWLATAAVLAQEAAPTLSETEQLRYQLVAAQSQIADLQAKLGACQLELQPLKVEATTAWVREAIAALTADIEAAHPGYTLDVETGALVKKDDAQDDRQP